jgi:ATP-dependent helicase/nuclease subunit A
VRDAFAAYQPSRIKAMPKDLECELSLRCKNTRTDINDEIKDAYAKYFPVDESEIPELFEKSGRLCVLLCDILFEFERRYSEEKLLRGICEFSDMPRFMMTLLQSPDGEPTEYARSLAAEYDEVYVDEYQDVNEIQDTIFKIIGGDRRFMVGDIKQSIYGFREAEPSIFADYREKFDKYDKNIPPSDKGRKIFMSENFRCDENVIDFSNLVCAPIFTAFKESIGYTSEDDLVFSKTRDEHEANVAKYRPLWEEYDRQQALAKQAQQPQ